MVEAADKDSSYGLRERNKNMTEEAGDSRPVTGVGQAKRASLDGGFRMVRDNSKGME